MRRVLYGVGLCGWFVLVACGGSPPPAEAPEPAPSDAPPAQSEGETGAAFDEASNADESSDAEPAAPDIKEPSFTEDMSVDEAVALVPRDAQRMNLDGDALGRPLMDVQLYEPCKLGQAQHFKLRVAIWNGKAVGVDVSTQPNNPRAAECIERQVRALTWRDKVPSLNTVEYAM